MSPQLVALPTAVTSKFQELVENHAYRLEPSNQDEIFRNFSQAAHDYTQIPEFDPETWVNDYFKRLPDLFLEEKADLINGFLKSLRALSRAKFPKSSKIKRMIAHLAR